MKVSDLYQLQIFLFMHDIVNNTFPGSCDEFIAMTNKSNYDIITRQSNHSTAQNYVLFELTKP